MAEENSTETADKVIGKPFEPGKSGNPNGRPLGQKNYSTLYREALVKLATMEGVEPDDLELEIILNGLKNAKVSDYRFYKDLLDRIHGKAPDTVRVEGNLKVALVEYFGENKDKPTS